MGFSNIVKILRENEKIYEKTISVRKIVSKIECHTETEYALFEDTLKNNSSLSNETTLVSEILDIINVYSFIIAPGQGTNLSDKVFGKQALVYLTQNGEFDYNIPEDNSVSPSHYFNFSEI